MNKLTNNHRIWIARAVAVVVDVLQIAVFPAFVEGFLSPLDLPLDVITAGVMIGLLGWHIAFVPTFIVKTLPFADLAPSWTIAVMIATRGMTAEPANDADPKPGRLV